jgi:hypothetical protein
VAPHWAAAPQGVRGKESGLVSCVNREATHLELLSVFFFKLFTNLKSVITERMCWKYLRFADVSLFVEYLDEFRAWVSNLRPAATFVNCAC